MIKNVCNGIMTKFFKLTSGEVRIIKDLDAAVDFINDCLMIPIMLNMCDAPTNQMLKAVWRDENHICCELSNSTIMVIKFRSLVIFYHPLSGMRGFLFSQEDQEISGEGILLNESDNILKQQQVRIQNKIYKTNDELTYILPLITMGKIKEEFTYINHYLTEGFILCFSTNFKDRMYENNSRLFKTIKNETDIINIYTTS